MLVFAALFGLTHIYQGPVSAIAVAVQGFLYAWYYKRFGRVWPMIIGHALYDSVQVIAVVIAVRSGLRYRLGGAKCITTTDFSDQAAN
jgi:membrane protease YdiL (CAAX protease family)